MNDRLGGGEDTTAGLLSAGYWPKKSRAPDAVVGSDGAGGALASAAEFLKNMGILEPVVGGGGTEVGSLSTAEDSATLVVSGVGAVREIVGAGGAGVVVGGGPKRGVDGLGAGSVSLAAKTGGAALFEPLASPAGLKRENGKAAMGGSFASVVSCLI